MKRVLFLQHGPLDKPGLLAEVLRERGVQMATLHPWRGEALPATLRGYDGLALSGGAQSVYDAASHPYLANEIKLIRIASTERVPTLGLCLGAQLIAAALGAEVKPNAQKEIGFPPIEFTPAAQRDPLWRDLPAQITPAHWHGDIFTLPAGAVQLASSALTPQQLFVKDEMHYALQFHLEMTLPGLRELIEDDAPCLRELGINLDEFLQQAREHLPAIEPIARTVFHRWVELTE